MPHVTRPRSDTQRKLSSPPRKTSGGTRTAMTIGHKLRNERERRGLQLNDVALALQIRTSALAAIEESRLEDLPSRAFTIGYVGRYARYLGLDVETLVSPLADVDQPIDVVPLPERQVRPIVVVLCALLLVALAYSGGEILAFVTRSYERVAEESPAQQAVAALTAAPVERAAPITAIESPVPLPAEVAVTPAVAPELASFVQEQLPVGQRLGLRNRTSRITLRVHRPTIVIVRGARNQVFIDRTLARGDTYRVPNRPGLRLTVDDAGAVEIMLDGASVGFVGEPGVAVRGLTLSPPSIAERQKRA